MSWTHLTRARALGILASFALGAGLAGGACDSSVPSDQGGTSSSSASTSGSTTASASASAASSGGLGGAGGASTSSGSGTGGMGTGGAPDCFTNPMTYVEIINACTNAQQVDLNPVLPLLEADGGLPPLP